MIGRKKTNIKHLWLLSLIVFISNKGYSQDTVFFCDFDEPLQTGWYKDALGLKGDKDNRTSWTYDIPNGGRGYNDMPGQKGFEGNPDPLIDHTPNNTVNKVAGQGLMPENHKEGMSSHYNNSNEWLITPAINCRNHYNLELRFWRWANFENGGDKAIIEISSDGINWINLGHPQYPQDKNWIEVVYDISAYADRKQNVYIRWRSESDGYIHYSGWNIDDVYIGGDYSNADATSVLSNGDLNEPLAISSIFNKYGERQMTLDFKISDLASGDSVPTIINALTIKPDVNNDITDWSKVIRGAIIKNNLSSNETNGEILTDALEFVFDSSEIIPDGNTIGFELSIFLEADLSGINDNDNLDFELDYTNIINDGNGSFVASGNVTSGPISIEIEATQLEIISQPASIATINRSLFPILKIGGADKNGNIDKDFIGTISLSNTGNLSMVNNRVVALQGIATFSNFVFTEIGGPALLKTANFEIPQLCNDSMTITVVDDPPLVIFEDNFDDGGISNWTTGASGINGGEDNRNSWEAGNPSGGQGYKEDQPKGFIGNPDPIIDHSDDNTNNNVIGQGLSTSSKFEGVSSHYNLSNEWIQTPAINCQGMTDIELSFWRWANFEVGTDKAVVEISNDLMNWYDLGHPLYPQDKGWIEVIYDISSYANNQPTVYIRWRSESNQITHYAGWNIDDVSITGIEYQVAKWTGSVSNEWNTPENWDINITPTSSTDVTIPASASNHPVISGSAICKNIVLEPGVNISIDATGLLEVIGDMDFLADVSGTATLIDEGTLVVNGNISMERYFEATGWQFISSPTVDINATQFGPKTYYYDEPLSSNDWTLGWVKGTSTMNIAQGYNTMQNAGTIIEYIGQLNSGYYEIDITNTDGIEVPEHEGWNLVGNPYPSVIDWDAASGWVKENIDNAIYIWDPQNRNYISYVDGVGTNGGTQYIQPMQSFFIKASNPGIGKLGMDNNVRVVSESQSPPARKNGTFSTELRMKISNGSYHDETIIRFLNGASPQFDQLFDAYKWFSEDIRVPQIYTNLNNDEAMAINSLPEIVDNIAIPVYIKIQSDGQYELTMNDISGILANRSIILEDKLTNKYIDLKQQSSYSFYSKGSDNPARFVVHISFKLSVETTKNDIKCNGNVDGSIHLDIDGGVEPFNITWSNGSTNHELTNLHKGIYHFTVKDAIMNKFSDSIIIAEPDAITLSLYGTHPTTVDNNDGIIDLNISGGIYPYNISWSNGIQEEDLFNLAAGSYYVIVTDENGCSMSDSIELLNPESPNVLNEFTDTKEIINVFTYNRTISIQILFTLETDYQVILYTLEGKLVNRYTFSENKSEIKLNNLGAYILLLSIDNYTYTQKLVVR